MIIDLPACHECLQAVACANLPGSFVVSEVGSFGGERRLVHAVPGLHALVHNQGRSVPEVAGQGLGEVWVGIGRTVGVLVRRRAGRHLPAVPSLRIVWLRKCLENSTNKLGETAVKASVEDELAQLLASMRMGQEAEHLESLLAMADYRGSDVRLLTGTLLDGTRQRCPYPGVAWRWKALCKRIPGSKSSI